jgi:hypothetical protein
LCISAVASELEERRIIRCNCPRVSPSITSLPSDAFWKTPSITAILGRLAA